MTRLKDKEEEIKRAKEEMDQMRKNVEEKDKKHAGEVAKLQRRIRESRRP